MGRVKFRLNRSSFGADRRLRISDQYSHAENEQAADDDLHDRGAERRVHEAIANPRDDGELHEDDAHGDARRGLHVRDEVGQRVADAAERGHRAHTDPRAHGRPRPVSEPSSESASAKPMLMPAPRLAARPTRNVFHESCVANAHAKSGASVETEPSISPARPGWMI